MIYLSLADLTVGIENKYKYTELLVKDYLSDGRDCDITVSVSDEEIENEAGDTYPKEYAESIAIYRKIAEELPKFGAFVFHGAVLATSEGAYAFAARSGVGKTTHVMNWLKKYPDVFVLNGDKPIFKKTGDKFKAYGTPWQGKENLGVNESRTLCGIALLGRGEENSSKRISPQSGLMRLMNQIYMPRDEEAASKTLELLSELLSSVSLFDVRVTMDEESAVCVREAFENK